MSLGTRRKAFVLVKAAGSASPPALIAEPVTASGLPGAVCENRLRAIRLAISGRAAPEAADGSS